MDNQKSVAQDYFDRHPSSNECFITSDGRVWHQQGAANGFAAGLKDDTVTPFKRSDVDKPVEDIDVNGATNADDIQDDKEITLESFDPESKTAYYDAVALVQKLGLTSPTQRKDDLFAAIAEAKVAAAVDTTQTTNE